MVAHDARRVSRRQRDQARALRVGKDLLRPWPVRTAVQSLVTQPLAAAVQGKQPLVEDYRVPLFDPDRLDHFESACSVLR